MTPSLHKLKTNNKGTSLVELIISFAILAIIGIAIAGLMSTGMGFFRNVSSLIGLQYEYQIVMTQLKEHIINCNAGIAFDEDENTLYVVHRDSSGYTVHIFWFNDDPSGDGGLFYGGDTYAALPEDIDIDEDDWHIISERITAFDADPEQRDGLYRVALEMEFTSDTRTYSAQQSIAIRNAIIVEDDYDDLRGELSEE